MKVFVFQQGQSLAGTPSWWLTIDDDEDGEELVEKGELTPGQLESIQEDGYFGGFYHTKSEAIESAKKKGWTVTNEE